MRLNIAQSPPPSPPYTLSPHRPSSTILSLSKSTATTHLTKSCTASFNGHDSPFHHHHFNQHPVHHFSSKPKFPTPKTTSFRSHVDTHVELLEPSILGIRPEPPDWPARDAVIRECIARRANSIDIPLSLRMIAMKQKCFNVEIGDLSNVVENNALNNLCCSILSIIREVQSCALKCRGVLLDEVLDDGIIVNVQRETVSSFVWLFKEVFAKTPEFMVDVMVLTSNFATHSLESFNLEKFEGGDLGVNSGFWGGGHSELGNSGVPTREILEDGQDLKVNSGFWGGGHLELGNLEVPTKEILGEDEVGLWNNVVEEADEMRGDQGMGQGVGFVVDRDQDDDSGGLIGEVKKFKLVSPVKVEIETDDYEEYHKTDLFYQIGLFQEPNNTLLLSNYAQFLCLVSRDYDRAEECYKRAIQLDQSDAEVISLYANFLWVVRKDLWGAEKRFQQAVAAEPDNSYHASKYASFLWSTGGEETCYPIDPPRGKS
ncbi:uncharacterized protein LOC141612370 [Silene latifolia]|uniref:uncharacterized protein LOC141612370 n=1 Tax=Silene latifolia TaxID=37657 RepID=UPI003D77432A